MENSELASKFEYLNNVKTKITAHVLVMNLPNNSLNQSIENAVVAFVKGADERNKFFEEVNNQ